MLEINEKDVWQRLKEDGKPIAVYGMGNAAEKIIEILHENEIEINEIFASDEFVRGHSFLGKRCLNTARFARNTMISTLCLHSPPTCRMCLKE